MFNTILNFIKSRKPDIIVQAPSRINIINPLDAVEGDFWMPSVAINGIENPLSAFLYLKRIKAPSKVILYKIDTKSSEYSIEIEQEEDLSKDIEEVKKKMNGDLKLIYASIYRFHLTNSNFFNRFISENFELGILTTIPRQSGLGGSAAIIISVLYGLAEYLNLYNSTACLNEKDFPINKDIIAEMATKIEDEDLNVTAGYSDRYTITRGGLCFCSYCGKLNHAKIGMEPLAVYDKIDDVYGIMELPIIICFSGVFHESGDVHGKLRELYLHKNSSIIKNYERLASLAWKARFALMKHDWSLLGELFTENTRVMNMIMKDAGFEYGIGLANNILIDLIKDHQDVYAAKLTGAGGGGCVFALVNPKNIDKVFQDWNERLNELISNQKLFNTKFPSYPSEILIDLKNAQFYRIKIDKTGVKKL
jgi:galactokinase/mevalonate kinase-like predicted kinase